MSKDKRRKQEADREAVRAEVSKLMGAMRSQLQAMYVAVQNLSWHARQYPDGIIAGAFKDTNLHDLLIDIEAAESAASNTGLPPSATLPDPIDVAKRRGLK